MATICYQCQLEILDYQDHLVRGDKHLHSGCLADFEAGSPVGKIPIGERKIEWILLNALIDSRRGSAD
jgi:hypothetical protein